MHFIIFLNNSVWILTVLNFPLLFLSPKQRQNNNNTKAQKRVKWITAKRKTSRVSKQRHMEVEIEINVAF